MERNNQLFTLILSLLRIVVFIPPKACVLGQFGEFRAKASFVKINLNDYITSTFHSTLIQSP